MHVQTPFTDDLDVVSEAALRPRDQRGNGVRGTRSLPTPGALNWGADEHALRLAVVAGNEAADQDEAVRFQTRLLRP